MYDSKNNYCPEAHNQPNPEFHSLNKIHVVLHEPEIPQNTGNIVRTCAATGASLHLIRPLGFEIDDRKLKRAGLDYWHSMDIHYYDNVEDFFLKNPEACVYFFTSKAQKNYSDVHYPENVYLMFGRESLGLPEELLVDHEETCVRIPMREGIRSLNLSNAVAIAVYEVLRQNEFCDMKPEGKLNRLSWK